MNRNSLLHGVRVAFVFCGLALFQLPTHAQSFVGTNAPGSAQNFAFTLGPSVTNLSVAVAGSGSTYSHLLLRAGLAPTDTDYDFIAQLDGAGNAINLEAPQFKLTNYVARVRTPVGSLTHVFTLNVVSNVTDIRNLARPATKPLVSTNSGSLPAAAWHYYRIEITSNNFAGWRLLLSSTNGAGPDLYVSRNQVPTQLNFDRRSQATTNDMLAYIGTELTPGAYFIGVFQPSGTANYTLRSEFLTITPLTWDPGLTHLGTQVYVNSNTNGGDFYFKVTVQNTALGAWRTALNVLNVLSNDANLYVSKGTLPAPNNNGYKSERPSSSDGFVVPASAFSAGEDWYFLVQAQPNAQWNLVTGDPFVTDLGITTADGSSGSGNVVMGAEGMRFFQTTVTNTPAWRLYLNGLTNSLLVKKSGVPVPGATELSQNGQMLVVPPYLVGGLLYFVGVVGTPGVTNNLDSRLQSIEDIAFSSATNLTVTGYPYRTFRVQVPFNQLAWQISSIVSNGNPNIAVRRNFVPNENYNDAYSEIASNVTDSITLVRPTLSDGTFFITVYSTNNFTCQLTSGNPEFTEIDYVSSTTNTDTNRTGWRFFRVSNISQQLNTLGWDLYVTNHTPGTRIAIRRNDPPGIWNYRNPNPAALGEVDAVGPGKGDFLQRPAHQPDVWYVGVFNTNAALGAFTLVAKELTAELVSFDTGFSTRTNVPAGKWQFFRVDVPAGIIGWDARVINVSTGAPRLVVRRELLPVSQGLIGFNNGFGATNWVTGDQFVAGSDFTRRDLSASGTNEAGRIMVVGYNRPLDAGTYYIGVTSLTGSTNDMSYTFLSRGIGTNLAIPVVDVAFSNGVVGNVLPVRDIAVYRVEIPTNAPSWKVKVGNTLGDASLAVAKGRLPNSGATISASVTEFDTVGKRQGRIGNEHFVQLPTGFDTTVESGPYYLIVQSEGLINPSPTNTTRVGTGDSAYTFTSFGPMPEVDLGLLTTNDIVYTTTLEGGEAAALHFQNDISGDATGFELNLDPVSGTPAIVSSPFYDLANPGSSSLGGGGVPLDPYGNDGGFDSATSYDIITVVDPFPEESVMVKPRGSVVNWPNSDFTLRIRKLVPAPIAFDGGFATRVGQTNLYEYFKIVVPPEALGWDIRLTNVTGSPLLMLSRDVLPVIFNTAFPGDSENWPSGALWIAGKDWTQRSTSATGVNEDGRIIACGMGRPLEPGTYYAAVYNSSGAPINYSILSRGIGGGFSIPVTDVPFTGGSVTNLALAPREAAYYRVLVPEGATSWQGRVTTLAGESLLVYLTNSVPSVLSGRSGDPGLAMQKATNEHFVALPLPTTQGTNMVLQPGTNYFAVVSEGVTNVNFPSRIGTNVSSFIFESRGQLQVVNLGLVGLEETRHTNTLQGGEVKAYQFDVPPGTTSLEARLYTTNGRPAQVLRVGPQFPNPGLASTIVGSGNVTGDAYGSDGGQTLTPLTGNANTNLITIVNPTNDTYTIMVKARASSANVYPNATYALGVRALSYTDVAFDGGTAVVTNQTQATWRYFKVEVPPEALGWDIRLANVISGLPKLVVCRDTLPATTLPLATKPWSTPEVLTNWPTTNQWAAEADWTRRTFSANNATNEDGRILAMGMGQPLEPGTYWVGVYVTGTTNAQYTLRSRGIGDGMSLPVVDLNYAGGSATVSNLAPREVKYYRVQVPEDSPGWKIRFTPTAGEAMLLVLSNAVPSVDSGRSVHVRAGKLLQKAGNEHYVLVPLPGQSTIYAGTYYLAAVSEGVNPASNTRIGTAASSFTITSIGDVPVTNLGPVTLTDMVRTNALDGGESQFYQFTVNPGTAAIEMRLENRVGNPVMVLITNTPLPDPGGLSTPKDLYGNDGGEVPDLINTNIITVANPAPGTYRLVVKARAVGTAYPDSTYTLRVRALPVTDLNFTAEFNTNGLNNVASALLLDAQRAFYRVMVPTNVHGQAILGWGLDLSQLSGVASVRVRKDELPSDAVPGIPFAPSAAVIVPPVLTNGTWYVEVKGSNTTQFTLESSTVRLQRPAWAMPAAGATNTAPGLTLPEFADSDVSTNGVPQPGEAGQNLESGKYHFYAVTVPTNNGALLRVQLTAYSGNPDLYVREDHLPTGSHRTNGVAGLVFDRALASQVTEYGNFVPIDGKKDTVLPPGTWYFAVRALSSTAARYRLELSTGNIQDLVLDGGSFVGQTVAADDWLYYRVFVPAEVNTNWQVTFSQAPGDLVLHVRDTIPPGNGYTNSAVDVRDWATDAKNNNGVGTYGNYDQAGTYTFTVPPVRPNTTYYLGFRARSLSTFSVSSVLLGNTNPIPPLIPFYGGFASNTLPPGTQLAYRIITPPEGLRWRHTAIHPAGVGMYIENGTFPTKNLNDDFRSTAANSSQDRLLTAYPWLPNQTYYLIVTNPSVSTQSFSFTMNGSGVNDDSDNDGMTDGWEMQYFGNLTPSATGDFDIDGVNNLNEFLEGTNPADKNSLRPRLTVISTNGTVAVVPFASNYVQGASVTLTPTPSNGYNFVGWIVGGVKVSANPLIISLTSNTTAVARFRVPADDFDQRIALVGFNAVSSLVNTNATKEPGEPNHGSNPGGRSIWWTWTAPGSGPVTMATTGNFRHALAIYTGGAVNALSGVTNQMAASGSTSNAITFNAVAGTTYQIAVDGFGGLVGSVTLSLSQAGGLVLSNPVRLGDGLFHFTISSAPGAVLTVHASTNLINWTQIAVVTNVTGTMDFADPASASLPRRYYRVSLGGTSQQSMTLAGAARQPDGNLRFTVNGGAGQVFRVLANTNPASASWTTLATLTNASGSLQYTDTTATNFPRRFYRTVSP
jgi:hypothetical protein